MSRRLGITMRDHRDHVAGSGWMYGSDGKRSPIDASREPSDPEYTDPDGRGW